MTVLVTGAGGQLGREIVRQFSIEGHVVALARADLDVTIRADVHQAIKTHQPDVVVNCAAWSDVDEHEVNPDQAYKINVDAPRFLREACEFSNSYLVHISTDFVFDGESEEPYIESHPAKPLNVYGETKLIGESEAGPLAAVVRTSWLQASDGFNIVERVFQALAQGHEIKLPGDRCSTPSFTEDVGGFIVLLAREHYSGVVHVANEGVTSLAELGRLVAIEAGYEPDLICETVEADYKPPRLAKRPHFSALENGVLRTLGYPSVRHHRNVVEEIVSRLKQV